MSKSYTVFIDDNYHYMDEGERYAIGSYDSLEKAIEACEKITLRSLNDLYEEGITPEALSARWAMFGEDPFIVGCENGVPFSARKYVTTALCRSLIDSKKCSG